MKNTLFLILFAFVLFLAIYFYWGKSQANSQLVVADEKITSLQEQVQRYTHRPLQDTTTLSPTRPRLETSTDGDKITPPASAAFEDELGRLSESDLNILKKKGLKSPEVELMNDLLQKQKSILTIKGSVGGTMTIRDVRILNDRYALAYFEDGHSGGYLLLRYAVANGTVTWTKLDSYIM